jgi:hypothetical protein
MVTEVRTSPKKARKPQARSLPLRQAILAVAARYERMSVRQLYYLLVAARVIPKTEAAYKRVCDFSAQMRIDGSLPYRKIADGHRTRQEVYAHDGLTEALESAQHHYRRNYWTNQPRLIEVWSEKDALSGVIRPVCDRYGVTYVACRGFPSITLRYESAQVFREAGKSVRIFYLGDHDASGRAISDNLEAELRQHGADVRVTRVALEPEQIDTYALPTRPGKASDSRQARFAATYGNASVELDALPPAVLTRLVEEAIEGEIDWASWKEVGRVEALERETFNSIARIAWEAGAHYSLTAQQEAI